MAMTGILVPVMIASGVLFAPELRFFPGEYFDASARTAIQRRAMERWPGPSAMVELWQGGELGRSDRLAILIGGAVHHDPALLPVYRDALQSRHGRVRQAAVYGYQDLLGDRPANVRAGVDRQRARRLVADMDRVAATLRRHPLIELWVNALLHTEGRSLGGYRGLVPDRAPGDCAFAIERIMRPEDLDLLVRAYQTAEERGTRIALMRLIEGLTLERFVVIPKGSGQGWGPEVYDRGFDALDAAIARWTASECAVDFQRVVSAQLSEMGLAGVDPLDPGSCEVWQRVLTGGDPGWWALAARRLYECGGPWIELSVLWAESEANRAARDSLLKWYGLAGTDVRRPIAKRPG